MTNIKERILQIAEIKGIGKEDFFKNLKLSYGNFKGKAKTKALSSDSLAIIVTTYSDISPLWILTGEGDKFINNKHTITEERQRTEDFRYTIKLQRDKIDLLEKENTLLKKEIEPTPNYHIAAEPIPQLKTNK